MVLLSLQESHLLFYFAKSVNQLSELRVWVEQSLSDGRERKGRLQHPAEN